MPTFLLGYLFFLRAVNCIEITSSALRLALGFINSAKDTSATNINYKTEKIFINIY